MLSTLIYTRFFALFLTFLVHCVYKDNWWWSNSNHGLAAIQYQSLIGMKYDSHFTIKPDFFRCFVRYFHIIFDFSTLYPLRQFFDRTRHLAIRVFFFWFRHYGFRFFGGQFQSNHALKWYFRVIFFFWFWIAIATKVPRSINTYLPSYYLQYFIKNSIDATDRPALSLWTNSENKVCVKKMKSHYIYLEPFQSTVKL